MRRKPEPDPFIGRQQQINEMQRQRAAIPKSPTACADLPGSPIDVAFVPCVACGHLAHYQIKCSSCQANVRMEQIEERLSAIESRADDGHH